MRVIAAWRSSSFASSFSSGSSLPDRKEASTTSFSGQIISKGPYIPSILNIKFIGPMVVLDVPPSKVSCKKMGYVLVCSYPRDNIFILALKPFSWGVGTAKPIPNEFSWTNLSSMLWVEQPVGTGFSQGVPNIKVSASSA